MLSQKFINTVKLSAKKGYEIAHESEVHPSTLSKLLNGIERPKPGDPRILRIGRVLGISPDECFSK